jgi:hypothetical protein
MKTNALSIWLIGYLELDAGSLLTTTYPYIAPDCDWIVGKRTVMGRKGV